MSDAITCPNCRQGTMEIFHEARGVPTNSCILLETRDEAVNYPKGDITLGFCGECGFVGNTSFDEKLTEYSGRYEETQGFSPTFQKFHRDLADRVIARFGLEGRDVLEIGCGKGEFLLLLCENGRNNGVGYDPGYRADRHAPAPGENVSFVADFYTEKCTDTAADFVCCKMTLEHIPATLDFMKMVRAAQGDREADIFFMIPEAMRILTDCAFEDVYYEHCSYFTPVSLTRLFSGAGFFPVECGVEYGDQYLTIAATTRDTGRSADVPADQLDQLKRWVAEFPDLFRRQLEFWGKRLGELHAQGKKTVIWGSGSKGVSFLTTLGLQDEIAGAVDINPHRHGYFMPGTGHRILGPDDLVELQPDAVIVMNPIYKEEITLDLAKRGLNPRMFAIDDGLETVREGS
ncbi:methyltransferase domain-containing protein [bacterium]|nr:methyltransferase domain-containing protein [bacterium]